MPKWEEQEYEHGLIQEHLDHLISLALDPQPCQWVLRTLGAELHVCWGSELPTGTFWKGTNYDMQNQM